MKQGTFHRAVGFLMILVLLALSVQVLAETGSAEPAKPVKEEAAGDWQITSDFNGQQMTSILSITKDKEGKLAGKLISFRGISELKDVKFDQNKLSFVQVNRSRDTESTTTFNGVVNQGKLSGIMSGERGERTIEGTRIVPIPAAVGTWEIKIKRGERETDATLTIKTDKEGKLTGGWKSQRGENPITDVKFTEEKLTFTRKSENQGRVSESTFEGTVRGDTLAGTMKNQRGDSAVEGKRTGSAIIGKWELTLSSERGDRTQILQVNPDLSGLYGSAPLEKISFEGDQVGFKLVMKFGEQTFENEFKGKLEGEKLTGELTSTRGSQKVTGKKITPAVPAAPAAKKE